MVLVDADCSCPEAELVEFASDVHDTESPIGPVT